MARPRSAIEPPEWFALSNYAGAANMDAADWYLNLALRRVVATTKNRFWAKQVQTQPLLRRAGGVPIQFAFASEELGSDFTKILNGRAPPSGVRQLRCDEYYFFEQMLPDHVRDFGRNFVPGESRSTDAPAGFAGPLDALFEPRFASAFVRVDFTLPDKTLLEDMKRFIVDRRAEFAAIGGSQPVRKTLDAIESKRQPKLRVWAARQLLPLMDLKHWILTEQPLFKDAQLMRLLQIEDNDFRQAVKEAETLALPMALDAWLLPLARAAIEPDA